MGCTSSKKDNVEKYKAESRLIDVKSKAGEVRKCVATFGHEDWLTNLHFKYSTRA